LDTETLVKVTMRGDKSVRGPHKGERWCTTPNKIILK
jgi:hypothetical protein